MHELAITEKILEISLDHAKKANAAQISNIHLVIGQLSSIVDDSVQFYWDFLAKDTIAEGADLHFRRLPLIIKCKLCNHTYSPKNQDLTCPECSGEKILIIQGEEFYLEAIDIDRPEPNQR
ncbi:MAG: hydrogenase maturation nickel metallochaperone HypA [Anaerolineales bacterium]